VGYGEGLFEQLTTIYGDKYDIIILA